MTSLAEQAAEVKAQAAQKIAPELLARMSAAMQRLMAENRVDRVVGTGEIAPDFALPDIDGRMIRLSDRWERGPVILTFYRGGWCPYCNLELQAYQRLLPHIGAAGASVVAVSPEAPEYAARTRQAHGLDFDVLVDAGLMAAAAYGLDWSLPDDMREIYQTLGVDLPLLNADGEWRLPVPATFVIGRDGIVTLAHAEVNYSSRLEPADALSAVRALA